MIRIVVQESDAVMAANVGGPVQMHHQFIDIDCPELEKLLSEKFPYRTQRVIGAEIIKEPK